MKNTSAVTYRYLAGGVSIAITRRHVGTAYAANGNVGNPTEYFVWDAFVDGEPVATAGKRSDAYEMALGNPVCAADGRVIGGPANLVRNWRVVQAEMRANLVRGE